MPFCNDNYANRQRPRRNSGSHKIFLMIMVIFFLAFDTSAVALIYTNYHNVRNAMAIVAQLVRALDCGSEVAGSNPGQSPKKKELKWKIFPARG